MNISPHNENGPTASEVSSKSCKTAQQLGQENNITSSTK
jgi:hypothetical protein